MLGLGKRFSARIFGTGAALLLAAAAACSGSSSSTLPSTTGILIRAETLTSGKGCGIEPSQIFKYVVVVYGYGGKGDPVAPESYDVAVTSNVFDCYTDGAFISLPVTNGSSTFRLEVFAYNRTAYDASRGVLDGASDVGRGLDPARLAGFGGELRSSTGPTWTTVCRGTQQQKVQALASCAPLSAGLGGVGGNVGPTTITLDTAAFVLPDGRVAECANAVTDGGVEAGSPIEAGADDGGLDDGGAGNGGDAGDGGDADAGDAGAPPLRFAQVRVRTRVGARIVADGVLPCPQRYSVEVPAQPAAYEVDVGLLDSAGNLVDPGAQTLCRATSVAGRSSSAVCLDRRDAGRD